MDATGMADYQELGRVLDESAAFDLEVSRLLEAGWNVSTQRLAVSMALCKVALEHAVSQRVLLATGKNNGTALALIRLHFEAIIRAAWVMHGASDNWIAEFSKPVPDGDLNEPQLGPPIPSMIDAIALKIPEMADEFRTLYATVKVMHSFVHGGAHQVAHALRGFGAQRLVYVLRNRNKLTLILCYVIVYGSNKAHLQGVVTRISNAYAGCMPPPKVM